MKVTLLPVGVVNANNRFYPEEVLTKEAERIKQSLSQDGAVEGIPGQIGYSSDPARFDLNRLAFFAKDIEVDESGLSATICISKTPEGEKLQEKLKEDSVVFRPLSLNAAWQEEDGGVEKVTQMQIGYIAAIPKSEDAFGDEL